MTYSRTLPYMSPCTYYTCTKIHTSCWSVCRLQFLWLLGGEELILSLFYLHSFLYSKHHCDPKLEDKRAHFSWFETLWGKPKPSFICRCVLGHGFVYSSVFSKLCWKVKSPFSWIPWRDKLCIVVIYSSEDVGCLLFACLTREHKPALKFSFTSYHSFGFLFLQCWGSNPRSYFLLSF